MNRVESFEEIFGVAAPDSTPEENDQDAELDLLPEFCHYRDDGCELAPSCLECPFPRCVDEEPSGRIKMTAQVRDTAIRQFYNAGEKNTADLAARFKVCRRTVERAVQSEEKAKYQA